MKFLLMFLLTVSVYSQNYELYTGAVISEDKQMHSNYMIGANFIIKTNQDRQYLNNLLFGFEHAAFMSNNKTYSIETQQPIVQDCNCQSEQINFDHTNSYTAKKEVRSISLNFGVEIIKRFYLITGVTNYQHISIVNNQKQGERRSMQIDAGIKYYIKAKDWYFSPTFKFNPETISFGIGVAR